MESFFQAEFTGFALVVQRVVYHWVNKLTNKMCKPNMNFYCVREFVRAGRPQNIIGVLSFAVWE